MKHFNMQWTFLVGLGAAVEEMDRVLVELARDVEDQLEGLGHGDLAPQGVASAIK